jgi:hypothetical protein
MYCLNRETPAPPRVCLIGGVQRSSCARRTSNRAASELYVDDDLQCFLANDVLREWFSLYLNWEKDFAE